MLCIMLPLGLASCSDDDDESTHTDASYLVGGTYTGTMYDANDAVKASDITVTVSRVDADTIQAITVKFTSTALNMSNESVFNVAKAGADRYTFSTGASGTTRNTGGVIEGNKITIYTTLSSRYKFNATTSAKRYTIIADKVSE